MPIYVKPNLVTSQDGTPVRDDKYYIKYCCYMHRRSKLGSPVHRMSECNVELPLCTICHGSDTLIVLETTMGMLKLLSNVEYRFECLSDVVRDDLDVSLRYKKMRRKYLRYYKKHNALYKRTLGIPTEVDSGSYILLDASVANDPWPSLSNGEYICM